MNQNIRQETKKSRCAAIVLAAGQGRRMNRAVPKQFLTIREKPVIVYALECFERSEIIDDIILVTGQEWVAYCQKEIIDAYHIKKLRNICVGGEERYDSVCAGLSCCRDVDYVFIHDGARPFADEAMIQRGYETVCACDACVAGMPSKDTVKIVNDRRIVTDTPIRSSVWNIQTPQVFSFELIHSAYLRMQEQKTADITDDAMVVERFADAKVAVYEGSYRNLKITTEDDLVIAEAYAAQL